MNIEDVCPVSETLDFFSRKWVLCILMDMFRKKAFHRISGIQSYIKQPCPIQNIKIYGRCQINQKRND